MKIVFMGVGALGSTAAVLCRGLKDVEFRFVDFDRVEGKNLWSQAFVKQAVGQNKAEALKAQFLNFWGIKAEARSVRCTADNVRELCQDAVLIVDCFDNQASRVTLSEYRKSTASRSPIYELGHNMGQSPVVYVPGLPQVYLVHAGMSGDGTFGIVRWDERFTADKEDQEGQATCEAGEHLPFIGQLSAALARVIQDFVERGEKRDVRVDLTSIRSTP